MEAPKTPVFFQEQVPTKRWCYLHVALFVLLYLVNLGTRELRSTEALVATIAAEMSETSTVWSTNVHGEPFESFPLYPWLVAACSGLHRPNEWTTRLPAALAVLALAGVCGYVAARAAGHLAGAVAAGMVLTSVACLGEGAKGSSNTVFALLMTTAWLAWYRFGRIDRRWWAAWFTSLFLVFVACLATGAYAIGYFYVPLLFLRRPLRAWPRMRILGHFVALGALAAGIALWLWLCPNQAFAPWRAAAVDGGVPAYAGYLRDVLTFPFRCAVDLFPWSFLAWPPFCVAFRPIEKTPVLCRFLRTVVGSLFLVAWLIPGASPRSLLPLVGPLAILTGLYYETLLRRHWPQLRNLVHYLTGAALAAGVACVITGLLHVAGVVVFASISPVAWGINMALLLAAVWLARWVRSSGTIRSFWLQLLLATAACRLVYLATYPPFHALCRGERRITGGWLAEAVPANETVYKTDPRLLVPECFYLQRPVRQIIDSRALPASERAKPVYVLAGDHPPILEPDRRVWTACSRPVDVRSRRVPRIRWGAGDRGILRVEADFVNSEEGGSDAATVRVYRGDLRPAAGEATPGPAGPAATRPGTKGTGS